jgi:hypothetical protein
MTGGLTAKADTILHMKWKVNNMATWKITPKYKKSVVEKGFWSKGDKTIINEIGWRWGEVVIETEDDVMPVITEDTNLFDYEVVEFSSDDGCWEDNEYIGFTDEEQENMEEFLTESSLFDLEEDGWFCDETELYFTCEVDIERIEE